MVLLSTMIAALVILARNEGLIAQLTKDEAQACVRRRGRGELGPAAPPAAAERGSPGRRLRAGRSAMSTYAGSMYNCYNCGAQFIRDYAVPASGPTFQTCSGGLHGAELQRGRDHSRCPAGGHDDHLPGDGRLPRGPVLHDARDRGHAIRRSRRRSRTAGLGAVFTYVWRIESSGTAGRARQQWVIHDSSVPVEHGGLVQRSRSTRSS